MQLTWMKFLHANNASPNIPYYGYSNLITHKDTHGLLTSFTKTLRLIFLSGSLLFLAGCETVSYYYQAVEGHLSILNKRRSIETLLETDLDEKTKSKLELVLKARQFAKEEMKLPVDDNYAHYVDLERDYVVWNVVAAPEFSIKPKKWCYPIVGCLSYRGYYDKDDALNYAKKLKQESLDVYTGGVAAYSTLGWFNDPVLNTFLRRDDANLAALIFHELAHQLLYFKHDTTFNESFATTVELEGLRRWLERYGNPADLKKRQTYLENKTTFLNFLLTFRQELAEVYESSSSDEQKRASKQKLFAGLEDKYNEQAKHWENPKIFSGWFKHPINNARLSTIATYHDQVKPLQTLLKIHNYDFKEFYAVCKSLENFTVEERRARLESLISSATVKEMAANLQTAVK